MHTVVLACPPVLTIFLCGLQFSSGVNVLPERGSSLDLYDCLFWALTCSFAKRAFYGTGTVRPFRKREYFLLENPPSLLTLEPLV
jgi:hypothetical protein